MIYLGKKQNEMLAKHKISLPDNLNHRIPTGWIPLISRTFDKLFDAGWDGRIFQIKEKLGALRISIPQNKTNLLRIVWAAEEESMTICDICSASGTIVDKKGILAARCEAHENVGDDYMALDEENFRGYNEDIQERIEREKNEPASDQQGVCRFRSFQ